MADPSKHGPLPPSASDSQGESEAGEAESEASLAAIAETIERGEDNYELPEEAVHEEPEAKASVSTLVSAKGETHDNVSVYSLVKSLNTGERIKLAMRGNRQARNVLLNDRVKMVRRYVLSNPRITDEELIALAKNRSVDLDLLNIIAANSEWLKKYPLRLALVTNPKTPIAVALRILPSLDFRNLRQLAKSRNVPSVVNSVAKRYVLRHQQRGV